MQASLLLHGLPARNPLLSRRPTILYNANSFRLNHPHIRAQSGIPRRPDFKPPKNTRAEDKINGTDKDDATDELERFPARKAKREMRNLAASWRTEEVNKRNKRNVNRLMVAAAFVFGVIGYMSIKSRKELDEATGADTPEAYPKTYSESTLSLYKRLPLGLISSWWGNLTLLYVPRPLRGIVFGGFAKLYGCNMDESIVDIKDFETFGDFFTRKLKPGVRPIYNVDIVSPADGKILHFGEIQEDTVEQIKGITYELSDFFGEDLHRLRKERRNLDRDGSKTAKKLYHCVIYLAPGDYHGFHSPVEWKIDDRRHFPGHLFPVAPAVVSRIQGLFALNERVVLTGEWSHGFFSYTPVGATNVGSIKLAFDDVKTNVRPKLKESHYDRHFDDVYAKKGDNLGFFHMGSTIVLIFESPEFEFMVNSGQEIRLGEPIGRLVGKSMIDVKTLKLTGDDRK